jgi:hypothetical protein
MDEATMVRQLNSASRKTSGGGLDTYWPAHQRGPALPIPVLPLSSLHTVDTALFDLAYSITRGAQVIDNAEPRTKLNSSSPGAMRSWHQNDKLMLPKKDISEDIAGLNGKARQYHLYVRDQKGLMNKQKLKGVAPRYTGYVEFTAVGWEAAHVNGRLVFDYQSNLLFLTPSHYRPMKLVGQQLVTSETDEIEGYQSPFFYLE